MSRTSHHITTARQTHESIFHPSGKRSEVNDKGELLLNVPHELVIGRYEVALLLLRKRDVQAIQKRASGLGEKVHRPADERNVRHEVGPGGSKFRVVCGTVTN